MGLMFSSIDGGEKWGLRSLLLRACEMNQRGLEWSPFASELALKSLLAPKNNVVVPFCVSLAFYLSTRKRIQLVHGIYHGNRSMATLTEASSVDGFSLCGLLGDGTISCA